MITLKLLGYWYSEREPFYPSPELFVDENFDLETKDWVIRYLKLSYPIMYYRGGSYCRFKCKYPTPGTSDNSDGEYIFPSGFIHYVQEHNVKPPQEFIEKVLSRIPDIIQIEEAEKNIAKRLLRETENKAKASNKIEINYDWWIELSNKLRPEKQ